MEDISGKDLIDNNYIIKDRLGKGGFGNVFLVKEINTGNEYAIKVLKKSDNLISEKIELIEKIFFL